MTSGPQRHGPKRIRNIAVPRLGDDCPFLELPPEVRNRIYEYALGGHNLHMFTWNRFEKRFTYQTRVIRNVVGTRATVGMRKLLTTPRLAMGLLRSCKQVYHEAALVPYYDNTFSFARGSDVEFFINDVLSEKQRAVLQHLTYASMQPETRTNGGHAVRDYLRTHFCDYRVLVGLVPKTIGMLSGLARLTITIDVDSINAYCSKHDLG